MIHTLRRWIATAWLMLLLIPSAQASSAACQPTIQSVHAARASSVLATRPTEGWEAVTLPDRWTHRWPSHSGSVWYRIEWDTGCAEHQAIATQPLGLLIGGISMAGALYLNDALLWRDASMTAPLSHSWNMPRWWPLPASALQPGRNTLWFHIVGVAELAPGMHLPVLGDASFIEAKHDQLLWRQRTIHGLSSALTAAVAAIFFVVWCMRRQEHAFGWFALVSLCWVFYVSSMLATSPWPIWPFTPNATNPYRDSLAMARLNLIAAVLYAQCFCIFTFRLGEQTLPRVERALWTLTAIAIAALVLVPRSIQESSSKIIILGVAAVFFGNCLQFQWHAWHTRRPQHLLLALCLGLFLVVSVHDTWIMLQEWHAHETWTPLASLIVIVFMAVLLGSQLATSTREVENFNHVLEVRIAQTRTELSKALDREHQQKLQHSRLQERVQLAHDLHDSLGGSLVRSIAVVERAQRMQQPMENDRMLSLLKLLRNDLRQIIDYGSVAAAATPASPEQWLAPLRHRFSRIFDELEIAWEWPLDDHWHSAQLQPSALQCLNIERLVEEALTNTLKHSHAQCIRVTCQQSVAEGTLTLRIEDDGVGFEVESAHEIGGLQVGLRSMAARTQHSGATLEVQSSPGKGTCIRVQLRGDVPPPTYSLTAHMPEPPRTALSQADSATEPC